MTLEIEVIHRPVFSLAGPLAICAVREVFLHTCVILWRLGFSAHEESFWGHPSKET